MQKQAYLSQQIILFDEDLRGGGGGGGHWGNINVEITSFCSTSKLPLVVLHIQILPDSQLEL